MNNIRHVLRRRRLAICIGLALLLGVLLVAYGVWSSMAWAGYQTSYVRSFDDMRQKADAATKLPAKTDRERAAKLLALKSVAASMHEARALCGLHTMVQWQQNVVRQYKERRQQCEDAARKLAGLSAHMQKTLIYLEDEQKVAKILISVKTADKLAEKGWSAQVTAWQKAAKDIKELAVSQEFVDVKGKAVSKCSAVAAAWKDVIAANKAKSEARYTKAEKALPRAYASLQDIGDTSAEKFKPLVIELESAYKLAFR